MKILITFFFLLINLSSSKADEYDWPMLDIELSSCLPKNALEKGKEWFDPKKFWIRQHVLLTTALDQDRLNYIEHVPACAIEHKDDLSATQRCVGYYTNRTAAMKNCISFAKKMCRLNGGSC